ncbi:unnamed protein product, partial [Porites lobata]
MLTIRATFWLSVYQTTVWARRESMKACKDNKTARSSRNVEPWDLSKRENFSDTFQTKELANGTLKKFRFLKCRIIVRSNKRWWNLEQRQLVTKLNSVKNKARRVNFPP